MNENHENNMKVEIIPQTKAIIPNIIPTTAIALFSSLLIPKPPKIIAAIPKMGDA